MTRGAIPRGDDNITYSRLAGSAWNSVVDEIEVLGEGYTG